LLREFGGDKAQARKCADMQETLTTLEAQLTTEREVKEQLGDDPLVNLQNKTMTPANGGGR
jgi:hypothetical protein